MNVKNLKFGLALSCLVLGACSGMIINSDWDREASFTHLKKYAWATNVRQDPNTNVKSSPFFDSRVRKAVDETLAAKGYALAPASQVDFLVGYDLVLNEKMDIYQPSGKWGYRGGIETYHYVEGSLILTASSRAPSRPIWRGWAEAEIDEDATPERREARINEAVAKILDRFPPNGKDPKAEK
jgi:hypothetical protein